MDPNYRLNCGQYVLHDGDQPIGAVLDSVAIALDKSSGTLHKHGSPELVERWLSTAQARFRQSGYPEMADDLVIIQGRFTLEDLNRCVSTSGYVGRLYQRLLAGAVTTLDPMGNPVPPASPEALHDHGHGVVSTLFDENGRPEPYCITLQPDTCGDYGSVSYVLEEAEARGKALLEAVARVRAARQVPAHL